MANYAENEYPIGEIRYFVTVNEYIYGGFISEVTDDSVQIVFNKDDVASTHACERRTLKKSSIIVAYEDRADAEEELRFIKELYALRDDYDNSH